MDGLGYAPSRCAGSAMEDESGRKHRSRGRVWIVFAVAAVLSAQPDPARSNDRDSEGGSGRESPQMRLALEAGWERIGDDDYFSTFLKYGFRLSVPEILCDGSTDGEGCRTRFRAGIQVPLRLRVVDRAPTNPGTIRRADWDETNDYLRALRFVEYGDEESSARVRIGEIGGHTVGHGTIVNDYFNVVTPDQHRTGATVNVEAGGWGGEALVSDLTGPSVVGGRVRVRPWELSGSESWGRRLTVGATVVGDLSAPTGLRRTPGQQPVPRSVRLPRVESDRATAVGGVDLSVNALDRESAAVAPYTDLNLHFDLGVGLHAGVRAELEASDRVDFEGRFEFRSLTGRYLPEYFGPLYEIDRFQFFGWGVLLPEPKLRVAADSRSDPVLGGYGEVTGRVSDLLEVSGAYSDHEGPRNADLRASVRVQPVDRMRLGVFYFKHNFEDFGELTDREGTFLVTETRVQIVGPLYGKGAYSLLWRLREDGVYRSVPRWTLGAGVSFGL